MGEDTVFPFFGSKGRSRIQIEKEGGKACLQAFCCPLASFSLRQEEAQNRLLQGVHGQAHPFEGRKEEEA